VATWKLLTTLYRLGSITCTDADSCSGTYISALAWRATLLTEPVPVWAYGRIELVALVDGPPGVGVARFGPGRSESCAGLEAPRLVEPADGKATRALPAATEQEPRASGIRAHVVNEAAKAA
jgi:hypothetical protein